jgi:hypothetical protein
MMLGLAAGALAVAGQEKTPVAAPAPPAVRVKLQDFVKDTAHMDNLVRAVEEMKKRSLKPTGSVEYRLSWEYWCAIHGFYGAKSKAGLLATKLAATPDDKKPFFEGIRDLEPPAEPAGLASEVWDQCTHSGPSGANLQFLTWHRVFLYYFERVLQDAAKDPTLRLPYWDYTDKDQGQLPAPFASPQLKDGRANPLYDARRSSQTVQLDPDGTDIDRVLEKTVFSEFSGEVELQPHGTVHCTVGPGCPYSVMGDVPISSNDPIFWFHHANIDRIFECWLQLGGKVPDDLLSQEYVFVDTKGARVTMKVGDLYKAGGPIDYTYDHVTNCGREALPQLTASSAAAAQAQPVAELAQVEGVAIADAATTATLPLPQTGTAAERLKKALAAKAGTASPVRVELLLKDITVKAPPGVLFKVFLATPGAAPRRRYVATLGFFGIGSHAMHGAGMPGRDIDVTRDLQALLGTSPDLSQIQVVFEATQGTAGSTLAAARPLFKKDAGLRIGSIRLQVKGE